MASMSLLARDRLLDSLKIHAGIEDDDKYYSLRREAVFDYHHTLGEVERFREGERVGGFIISHPVRVRGPPHTFDELPFEHIVYCVANRIMNPFNRIAEPRDLLDVVMLSVPERLRIPSKMYDWNMEYHGGHEMQLEVMAASNAYKTPFDPTAHALDDFDLDNYPEPVLTGEYAKLSQNLQLVNGRGRQAGIYRLGLAVERIPDDIDLTPLDATFAFHIPNLFRPEEKVNVRVPDAIYYDCDQVRAMIKTFIRDGDWTIEDFRQSLVYHSIKLLEPKQLQTFLEKRGPKEGCKSRAYVLAWEFFHRREQLGLGLGTTRGSREDELFLKWRPSDDPALKVPVPDMLAWIRKTHNYWEKSQEVVVSAKRKRPADTARAGVNKRLRITERSYGRCQCGKRC
ncbi:hypothetical protein QBC34DRAFT_466598 [Podospora aff. communis PSN243]|uniref:DUF7726 domain-containing protein n=1 Tax=Podospora aff. communis PSN243 TaxID=3040156 RepID=A0AAV9GHJ5_9PEZI|nr:hypothetical protein QBC34DRAFT_466598 [Podospora aff. communis PSN243]